MGAHINEKGQFQSDKYDWCKPDFLPLKLTDQMAWPHIWAYAEARRVVDAEFTEDIQMRLRALGYIPPEETE